MQATYLMAANRGALNIELLHFFICDAFPFIVVTLQHKGLNLQFGIGRGSANTARHDLETPQRFAGPVSTDKTKHALFYGILL